MKKSGFLLGVLLFFLFLYFIPAVHADVVPRFLQDLLRKAFEGNLFQQEWAGRSVFALLVFTLLFWAAGFIFKNAGGTRFTVALILAVISGIGVPKVFIDTMLVTYGFVSGLFVVLGSVFGVLYLQRFFPDTRAGQLGRIGLYLLVFILLTYIAKSLALDSKFISAGSKLSIKFKDIFALVQIVLVFLIFRAFMKLFSGAGSRAGGGGWGSGRGAGIAGLGDRIQDMPQPAAFREQTDLPGNLLAGEEQRALKREEQADTRQEEETGREEELTEKTMPKEERQLENAVRAEEAMLDDAAEATADTSLTLPDHETLKRDIEELNAFSGEVDRYLRKLTDSLNELERFEREEYDKTFKAAEAAKQDYEKIRGISGRPLKSGDPEFERLKLYRKKIADEIALKIRETRDGIEQGIVALNRNEAEFRRLLREAFHSLEETPRNIRLAHARLLEAKTVKERQETLLRELELHERKVSGISRHEFADLENERKVAELLRRSAGMEL